MKVNIFIPNGLDCPMQAGFTWLPYARLECIISGQTRSIPKMPMVKMLYSIISGQTRSIPKMPIVKMLYSIISGQIRSIPTMQR